MRTKGRAASGTTRLTLKRRREFRRPKELLLVVTEGGKTEPRYFKAMRDSYRLSTANIEITPSDYGTDPTSVINYAIDRKQERERDNKIEDEPLYDAIYCVIDRDRHSNFGNAVTKGRDHKLHVIRSVPCFEIWLRLHFAYSSKPYENCNKVIKDLKKNIPGYKKNLEIFSFISDKTDAAISNAERLFKEQSAVFNVRIQHPNPFTEVDKLVTHLISLASTS